MKKLFQTLTIALGILGATFLMGCSKQQNVDSEAYLRCNKTSNGRMMETESGYFYLYNQIIYYADKDQLDMWVPLCNRPTCLHNSSPQGAISEDDWCNGYSWMGRIIEKNGKIYGIDRNSNIPNVIEIAQDGSGSKKVYTIPWEEQDIPTAGILVEHGDYGLMTMSYIDEKGLNKARLISLKENEQGEVVVNTLYEDERVYILAGDSRWEMHGDDVFVTDIDLEDGKNLWRNLWQVKDDELVDLNIPDDIHLYDSYLSGNELTYYEQDDGFYKLNLDTGEKQLIAESQVKDGYGVIFSDELIFEYNCYSADVFEEGEMFGYYPERTWEEETCVYMYDGTQWKKVQIPEELLTSKRSGSPKAVTSDRVFFSFATGNRYRSDLYYIMLEEKNPKLVYAGQISDEQMAAEEDEKEEIEETTSGTTNNTTEFDEITIFDNEDCVLKITNVKQWMSSYDIYFFFEDGDSERKYEVEIESVINGIQFDAPQSFGTEEWNPERGEVKMTFHKDSLKQYGITDVYAVDEITDIELIFYMYDDNPLSFGEGLVKKSVHIYPKGEDAVVYYTREPQESDIVVVDNEKVEVTVIGYETTKIENDTPIFFIENKTDQEIYFQIDAASINGAQDNTILDSANEIIQGGACAFVKANLGEEGWMRNAIRVFWDDYDVTEIGTIKALVSVSYFDVVKYKEIGEPLAEGFCTLYPKGEEYAREDARPLQEMEDVLIDNEYIKLTHIGYQDFSTRSGGETIVIPDCHARFLVENKTDRVLYANWPFIGENGMVDTCTWMTYTLLPGDCYVQVLQGGIKRDSQGNMTKAPIYKNEFIYQILDKDQNVLNQEYAVIYPLGEENVEYVETDLESMEEILVDHEQFAIAVGEYKGDDYEGITYEKSYIRLCFVNKSNKKLYWEISDITANGVSYIPRYTGIFDTYVVFAHGTCWSEQVMSKTLSEAGVTELEEVEMTFKVYAYNDEDGSFGEELGSQTVKFGPK